MQLEALPQKHEFCRVARDFGVEVFEQIWEYCEIPLDDVPIYLADPLNWFRSDP